MSKWERSPMQLKHIQFTLQEQIYFGGQEEQWEGKKGRVIKK